MEGEHKLFVCFTSRTSSVRLGPKCSLSPGREKLRESSSRRLRGHGSKGHSSPMFPVLIPYNLTGRKKNSSFETQEPSSPKVTCIGQVRVKSKHAKRLNARKVTRRHSEECSRKWGHIFKKEVSFNICEALRSFGAEFNCFVPCGSTSQTPKEHKEGTSCGAVFAKWFMVMQEDERKTFEQEHSDVVLQHHPRGLLDDVHHNSGGLLEDVHHHHHQSRVLFGDSKARVLFEDSKPRVSFEDSSICEDASTIEPGRHSVKGTEDFEMVVPPRNALLLMRCRSDPMKMSSMVEDMRNRMEPMRKSCAEVERRSFVREDDEDEQYRGDGRGFVLRLEKEYDDFNKSDCSQDKTAETSRSDYDEEDDDSEDSDVGFSIIEEEEEEEFDELQNVQEHVVPDEASSSNCKEEICYEEACSELAAIARKSCDKDFESQALLLEISQATNQSSSVLRKYQQSEEILEESNQAEDGMQKPDQFDRLKDNNHSEKALEENDHSEKALEGSDHSEKALEENYHSEKALEGSDHSEKALEGSNHLEKTLRGSYQSVKSLQRDDHSDKFLHECDPSDETSHENDRAEKVLQEHDEVDQSLLKNDQAEKGLWKNDKAERDIHKYDLAEKYLQKTDQTEKGLEKTCHSEKCGESKERNDRDNVERPMELVNVAEALPDALLLMMYEPKLSMEISKETWVSKEDFIRRPAMNKEKDQTRSKFSKPAIISEDNKENASTSYKPTYENASTSTSYRPNKENVNTTGKPNEKLQKEAEKHQSKEEEAITKQGSKVQEYPQIESVKNINMGSRNQEYPQVESVKNMNMNMNMVTKNQEYPQVESVKNINLGSKNQYPQIESVKSINRGSLHDIAKLHEATAAATAFVLPRCKSEPLRASVKLVPEACFWKPRNFEIPAFNIKIGARLGF